MKIHGYAAHKAKEALKPLSYEPDRLNPGDVLVKISHCGICHSDLHLIDNDWGMSTYPFIPGHEIVGTVSAVGGKVKHLKPGQRVGIGWQRYSCGQCELCKSGYENLCAKSQPTCVGHHGGFADGIQVDARFAFPIPDALDSDVAAPLLCAGITVFSPFITHNVQKGMKVGIVGIGGLGHVAVQFAHAMGCEVTAFSTTTSKKAEATKMGADHFVATGETWALKKAANSMDFVLSTVSGTLDWNGYLDALKARGILCVVGVATNPASISAGALLSGQKAISGSAIGSPDMIRKMLAFAAKHKIKPMIERMKLPEVNEALGKVRKNEARYRMVLKA